VYRSDCLHVEQQTVDAWLVHLADYADQRLWGWTRQLPESKASAA
jgi:hypothetical protein